MKLISVMWLIISSCSTSLCLDSAADSRSIALENYNETFCQKLEPYFTFNNSVDQSIPNNNRQGDHDQKKCQSNMYGGYIKCNPTDSSLELSYPGVWAGCINDSRKIVAGNTPYSRILSSKFTQTLKGNIGNDLCSRFNRSDTLCGKCMDGYSPTANSELFQCIPCQHNASGFMIIHNLVFYILTELFPPTILIGFIMFFNLNLTSASANGFIFFSQVFQPIFSIYGNKWYMENIGRFYSASYDIWNLNFFKSFRFLDYCIHSDMKTIHVIALEYIVALYPLFFIGILYAIVTLYNKGFRCVLWCGRPVHRFVARFRRPWKLSTTIAHTFAAFLVLSFTKFTLISFRLLAPSYLYNEKDQVISVRVYYQGDMGLFKGVHVIYGTIAMTILLLFVLLPTFLLLLFPLKWFRLSVRYLTFKKFELTGGKLELFLNIFYGGFKDGTKPGTRDLRCFAGLYFVFRIVFQCITFNQFWNNHYLMQHIFLIVVGFLFAIVRPYRVDFWNNFDAFIFANMTLISVLSQYNYQYFKDTDNPEVMTGAFEMAIILIGLPLLFAILYLLHKLWKKIFTRSRKKLYFMKLFSGGTDTNNKQSDTSILKLIDDRSLILDHVSDDDDDDDHPLPPPSTSLHPSQGDVPNIKNGLGDGDKNGSTYGSLSGSMTSGIWKYTGINA